MCLHTAAVFAVSPNTRNTVRGKIVNETGEPIIGAIVTLKGNKNVGTNTDADGNFVLAYNDNKAEALNVNYIGCASMEVEVKEGEENVGTIKMSQDAYSLQDVVVMCPSCSAPQTSMVTLASHGHHRARCMHR